MKLYIIKKQIADDKIQRIRQKGQQLTQRYSELIVRHQNLTQQNDGSSVNHTDKICLNVGGTEMYATREMLTQIKGSRLEALFNGRWDNKLLRDKKRRVFMDMDVRYLKPIIDHLHSMTANGDAGDCGGGNILDWPKLSNTFDQKMLELYIKLFRLREDHGISNVSENNIINSGTESHDETNLLQQAVKNEAEELEKFKNNLNDMEKELEEEEDFVSFFTTIHPHMQVK